MPEIQYGTEKLAFHLEYTDRKSMAIEVHPDKSIWVIAPAETDYSEIQKRVIKRARWIIKQQKYFDQFLPRIPERKYVSGESHKYLGRKYVLKTFMNKQKDIKLQGGIIKVSSPHQDPQVVKALLSSWYYNHAIVKFKEVFKESLPLFDRFDIGNPQMEIRRMKNRWGSCTPKGKILVNPELIKVPKRCIQYVVIHELCHLVIPGHTKKFYELLAELMPDWPRWKNRLEVERSL